MTNTEFLLTLSIQNQAASDEIKEKCQLEDDQVPNSPNLHHKNCMTDSKENYHRDLGREMVLSNGESFASLL